MINCRSPGSFHAWRRCLLVAAAFFAVMGLQGCYYMQAVHGQVGIWQKSRPLDDVINDAQTDPALAGRLRLLREARGFATVKLQLPDNGSYRKYADLGRDYVLWNVVAVPEFSLQPRTWCYLIVGCLAYRGYFDVDDAARLATRLRGQSYDVYLGGVPAYSTLGRLNDPLLNTMLDRDDADLVALLFHELAHQRLYIKDDTAFNESFASAVAELGLQQWFAERGDGQSAGRWLQQQELAAQRMEIIGATRARLDALYEGDLPDVEKRAAKQALFEQLRTRLAGSSPQASGWSEADLNNAWLATVALYRGYLPAFRRLFANCERNWTCFYRAVDALAAQSADARAGSIERLTAGAGAP